MEMPWDILEAEADHDTLVCFSLALYSPHQLAVPTNVSGQHLGMVGHQSVPPEIGAA
jgi:hypothetical protein